MGGAATEAARSGGVDVAALEERAAELEAALAASQANLDASDALEAVATGDDHAGSGASPREREREILALIDSLEQRREQGPPEPRRGSAAAAAGSAGHGGDFHRVGPKCATWPSVLNENPYQKTELGHDLD